MTITFKKADINDLDICIDIQNKAFYEDYLRYGSCPSYNRADKKMADIINNHFDFIIYANDKAVGNIIIKLKQNNECHINSLGVIPQYQNIGIGQKALDFIATQFYSAKLFTLDTPADKKINLHFYEKMGYKRTGESNSSGTTCILYEKQL